MSVRLHYLNDIMDVTQYQPFNGTNMVVTLRMVCGSDGDNNDEH